MGRRKDPPAQILSPARRFVEPEARPRDAPFLVWCSVAAARPLSSATSSRDNTAVMFAVVSAGFLNVSTSSPTGPCSPCLSVCACEPSRSPLTKARTRIDRPHSEQYSVAIVQRVRLGYTIVDLGSRNGTFVNGERLGSQAHTLKHGDKVQWGRRCSHSEIR